MTRAPDSPPPPLRRVRPPEAPVDGELVESGGAVLYRVSAADAPLALWQARPGGHLLAAVDLDRVDGVTMLVLPRLVGRVRTGDGIEAPTPGQAVTLAVSVLRGARAARLAEWSTGEWWLADGGRPVLVPVGDTPAIEASVLVLESTVTGVLGPGIVQRAVDALRDDDTAELAAIEDALFGAAIPEPLGERLVRAAPDEGARTPATRETRRTPAGETVRPLIERLVDADVATRITDAWVAARAAVGRRRLTTVRAAGEPTKRHRMVVVAGVVAAATLALGLLWPQPDTTEAASAPQPPTPTASVPASPVETSPVEREEPDATPTLPGTEALASAAATVEALATCWHANEAACRAEVLERPDAVVPEGIATADARREVVLLDDLGGVEVVRVDDPAGDRRSQIVVIVVRDDERLVRDVYDVADQP